MPRQDSVQIRIDFITDESKAFANVLNDTKKLQKELKTAQKNGGDVNAVLQKIVDSGQSLKNIDLSKLMPAQLITRANQLKQALKFIPDGHPSRVQMETELKRINDQMAMMNSKTKGVSNAMTGLRQNAGGLSGVFEQAFSFFAGGGLLSIVQTVLGGIFNLGKTAIKASGDMESLRASVELFLGSGAATTKFLKQIQDFAAKTPFEFPELAEAGKKLLSFGYDGEEAMGLIKRLGEVASAAQIPISELASIIGKAKLGQKIQGEELNQLADRGINIFPELARVLGTTESQIKKLGSEGKIAYSDLEKAITLATDKGGKFFGLMEKQSGTFNGLISTLSDNFGQFIQSIFGGVTNSLKPIIKGVAEFFGQLTDFIREGKKPVGEYAEVIQYAGNMLKILGNVFGVVWEVGKLVIGMFIEQVKVIAYVANRVGDLIGWFQGLAEQAKKIPIIGTLFKPVLDAIGLVSDLLSNAAATFAGFRAAAEQAVVNVQNYFRALIIDTQILGSKIAAALSFNDEVKKASEEYIKQLESRKDAMFKAGKTVEQAYTQGRNAAIVAQNKAEAEGEIIKRAKAKANVEVDAKAAEKAENDRLKRVKDALDIELKDKEIFYKREEVINELALTKKTVTESDFNKKAIEIERDKYESLIKVYDTYQNAFGAKSEEFRNIEIKKLELQSKIIKANAELAPRNTQITEGLPTLSATGVQQSTTGPGLDSLGNQEAGEIRLASVKFDKLIGMEQAFEVEKLRIRAEYAGKELDFALKNGETEKGQIAQLNRDKKAADDAFQAGLRENEQRTADLKAELEKTKFGLAIQTIELGIELLSKDEAARKKNAAAIKAFQVAQITIDGISEVAAIWRNASSNPINAIIPGAGAVIGAIQTALAVGRTIVGVRKVNAQKFAGGGFTGYGGMQDETGYAVRGVVHEGEYVIPKRIVENPSFAPTLSMIESSRLSGFAVGGYATTPTFTNFSAPVTNNTLSTRSLEAKMDGYMAKIDNWASNLEVSLPIISLEKKMKEVNLDRVSSAT